VSLNRARLRRAVRRDTFGVDVGGALNLVGALLRYFSLTFLYPAAIALGYDEPAWPFFAAGAITAVCGFGLERVTRGRDRIGPREGFLVVSLTWLLAAGFGSLPYLFVEPQLDNPIDALFETMSGFTTTGASVLTDNEGISHSIAMWRQFTCWLGGMGIVVLALAVLPRLRVGGRQLMEFEAPGPELETLTASVRNSARRLWLLYVGISAAEILALTLVGLFRLDERMSLYEAVAHTFSTMATAGFSTQARSIEAFGAASQWVIVLFMFLAGANFALTYRALVLRRPGALPRDEEFRVYAGFLALGSLVIFLELVAEGVHAGEEAVRHAVFQAVSIMTTTGFASTDFNLWPAFTALVLVALMFVGGSAGSTGGAIKPVRFLLLGRLLRRELDQTVHPELVAPLRFNRALVDERTLRGVIVFVVLYLAIFALGALGLMADAARVNLELSPFEAVAASATTLGNVGPSFGFAGPMGTFAPFSDVSTVIMTALMWFGRLELIPIAVLLTRAYWRA